jgi:hypothetical protein
MDTFVAPPSRRVELIVRSAEHMCMSPDWQALAGRIVSWALSADAASSSAWVPAFHDALAKACMACAFDRVGQETGFPHTHMCLERAAPEHAALALREFEQGSLASVPAHVDLVVSLARMGYSSELPKFLLHSYFQLRWWCWKCSLVLPVRLTAAWRFVAACSAGRRRGLARRPFGPRRPRGWE